MTSKEGYKKVREWLDEREQKGFHLNSCCLIMVDHKAKDFSCFVATEKRAMARSLAAVFLDSEVMWKAFKYANRLALQEKRKKKEVENVSK